jgi:ethanolamine ammonia-lyase large subunit
MRLQDLIAVAAKCRTVTRFRNTIGLEHFPPDAGHHP